VSLNTTPRTFVTAEIETAAIFNAEVRDALTGIQAAWTAYTPTAANLTVGNGSLAGRWAQIGKTAIGVRINFVAGSTTTYTATGATFTLPAAAHGTSTQLLVALMNGNVAGVSDIAAGASVTTPKFSTSAANPLLVAVSTASGFTPGTTGNIVIEGTYELA
jgi:hypothetical protein